jgi:hypothetical protein
MKFLRTAPKTTPIRKSRWAGGPDHRIHFTLKGAPSKLLRRRIK